MVDKIVKVEIYLVSFFFYVVCINIILWWNDYKVGMFGIYILYGF